jgi:hypothetical protein
VRGQLQHRAEAVAHVQHRCDQTEGALIGNLIQADTVPASASLNAFSTALCVSSACETMHGQEAMQAAEEATPAKHLSGYVRGAD